MINVEYPRRGFVVEEIVEGCKTEGCNAEKFVVNSWEHYGEDTFNDLTEGCKRGEHSEGDHTEGICPKCRKPVVYKDYFVVTSDASTIKIAEDALNYAVDVLSAPFPEGEALIATDAHWSYNYAKVILKAPFSLGEPAIAKDAIYSYKYAKDILKAPFLLGEAAIATDAEYSYYYARDVLNAPFPEGESLIATDAEYSYKYAKHILKAPFLLGEKTIATNEYYYKEYKKLFSEPQAPTTPQVASTEGDSKMKDIQEVYRKRVFDELTPVQLDEILLGEIDELNPPIKIGSLEFRASEIIKQLRPDVLENNDFLVALFESEEWYESMMNGLDGGYCWLYPPTDENGEYLKYEGVDPKNDWSFFRWQGCHRIMRESKIYFLQEYKNILLQENQNDLLQKVKKELQYCLKHEDPVEIEIYSRTTSVRRFLNSNGEESFRAIETPEPSVIPEPQATPEPQAPDSMNIVSGFYLKEKSSMSDKQKRKDVIKSTFLTLVYTLEDIIDYDQEGGTYHFIGSLFQADNILKSIHDLMEKFPNLTRDLAEETYPKVKSYMDEYSKYRKEKQEKEKPHV